MKKYRRWYGWSDGMFDDTLSLTLVVATIWQFKIMSEDGEDISQQSFIAVNIKILRCEEIVQHESGVGDRWEWNNVKVSVRNMLFTRPTQVALLVVSNV